MLLILQSLLFGARADLASAGARWRRMLLWGAVAAVLLLTAYVSAVVAIAVYLAEEAGLVAALVTVAVATAALAIAVIAYVLARNRMDRQRHPPVSMRLRVASEQAGLGALAGLMQNRPVGTVLMIALMAFLGTRMGTRNR
ncbi:hypothetical protein M8R20_02455 [Pseudomonas sp. R2.Fl]|nr:hypothetical protein [Pseudomonas sp. R2.Fl]